MKKRTTVLLLSLCLILAPRPALARSVDLTAMEFVFQRFEALGAFKKALAWQYLEGAMDSEASLEAFKKTAAFLLNEERRALLEKNGIAFSDIENNLEVLKTWPRKDRFQLMALFREGDRSGIEALNALHAEGPRFADLTGHWAREAVEALARLGLAKGRAPGQFVPGDPVTRAEFAALLVRLAETRYRLPESGEPLLDVAPGAWHEGILRKALAAGILKGDGKGTLRPGDGITRQEMAVMAANTARRLSMDLPNPAFLFTFRDAGSAAPWARDALARLKALGWIKGLTDTELAPGGPVTRAQAAVLLKRMYDTLNP